MTIEVVPGDPRDPQATALLQQSHALMESLFPPEDNFFLNIDDLCVPEISFFVAREGDTVLGTGALADKGDYGEVKSMFVSPVARGKGVGEALASPDRSHLSRRQGPRGDEAGNRQCALRGASSV